ncbi:ABC transporter ATP-binding protein [Brachybacterium sp. NBEC-018]|uniref:ABC transporter ATP-binding protein n=1 Tax=Brachybacterium sp. NBEC-018 TaxID=2996004 RepID=UPI002175127F|nr:ABC transporter ATP-binding protein [Brachybacterium sp. NBEC-018]UVY84822.1 ABC transporter ATP-binding protein [Brachybacterium sp. NBEC-018]
MTAAEPLLHLEGLRRWVRLPSGEDLHILRGVDLEVDAGDHVAIVGRSGSGKSTLLNLLGLIDRQSDGVLRFDGQDVHRLRDARRARLRGASIGFVFQQFNLLDGRTALENVMMPLLYGDARQFWHREKLAREMLDRVGLGDRADQVPARLSGGEQQRVAVARALVRRPRLILADEPTGALDVSTGEAVMALLDEIARDSDAALVTITHDLQVAALSQRAYLLDEGTLHDIGTLDAAGTAEARTALAATAGLRAGREAVA